MKAIIHIGTEKTGTTTIQEFLHLNRSALESKGIALLKSTGLRNSRNLPAFCMESERIDNHAKKLNLPTPKDRNIWKINFQKEYLKELKKLDNHIHSVIFSSEHFHSRLQSYASVSRLQNLLSENFDDFKILVYLRRQDEVAVSLYSTALKSGKIRDKILPNVNTNSDYYNYHKLLLKWSNIFGLKNIFPRVFDKTRFINNNLIDDFIFTCGIDKSSDNFMIPENKNETLSAYTQEFINTFNKNCFDYFHEKPKILKKLREYIIQDLQNNCKKAPNLPSREQAIKFYSKFEKSNQEVAKTWFNGELFNQDFRKYPIDPPKPICITADEMMKELMNAFEKLESSPTR